MRLNDNYGSTPIKRIVAFYSNQFNNRYGFRPRVNYGQIGGLFKPLLETLSEYQIALMILVHFEWKGATGDNEFVHKTLEGACFPLEWLPRGSNAYEAFIRNNLSIKFDDPEEVKAIVDEKA